MDKRLERAWAEIDIDSIAYNIKEIRSFIKSETLIMAVVKANAYGHGVLKVAETLLANGADRLAVATLDEAILLRKHGFSVPLQVLSHTFEGRANEILDYNIIQTIYNMELANAISLEALKRRVKATIHIKVNTGMNRVGVSHDENGEKAIVQIYGMPGLVMEGIMTHFASADESNIDYTYRQFELFIDFCNRLERAGIRPPLRHVCNSAAVLRFPEMHLEMVRPGLLLYGLYPSADMEISSVLLRPVMSLKACIININCIPEGAALSYGRTHVTKRKSLIATVPIGYGDGFPRRLSNNGKILIGGEFAPIVGTICMDQCLADITEIGDPVSVGDEVVLFGKQGRNEISVEEIAGKLGTITYEVLCDIGMRIPRIYTKNKD
ncbi:MAG: alanine racemase [Clostridiales bacterium GWC2_40_7]|nr:MAG: alanine racemase [Clostridiales bacterium GWC2_40_7]